MTYQLHWLVCQKCSNTWLPRVDPTMIRQCPACRSLKWDGKNREPLIVASSTTPTPKEIAAAMKNL